MQTTLLKKLCASSNYEVLHKNVCVCVCFNVAPIYMCVYV